MHQASASAAENRVWYSRQTERESAATAGEKSKAEVAAVAAVVAAAAASAGGTLHTPAGPRR